jgi:hypothetical protein
MREMRGFVVAIGLVLLVAGAWWLGRSKRPVYDGAAVLAQVQQLNQLSTVQYTIQKIVGLKEPKEPLGEESILLIVQAVVKAGIDLSAMRPEDVTVRPDGAVVLRLPPPQILSVAIDEKETKVWDRQKTWWTPWVPYSLDLERRARLEGLESAKKAALEMGILFQADKNAESSIRGLLGLAGVKTAVIIPGRAS